MLDILTVLEAKTSHIFRCVPKGGGGHRRTSAARALARGSINFEGAPTELGPLPKLQNYFFQSLYFWDS